MKKSALTAVKIVEICVTIVLAVLVVFFAYYKYNKEYNYFIIALCLVLGGFIAAIISDSLHELGHLIIGKICDFSFNCIRIAFIKIYKHCGKVKVTFKRLPDSIAGAIEMLPKNSKNLKKRFLLTVSGGPLFSFVVFVFCLISFILHDKLHFAAYALICTGLPYAFHLFFYNALPLNFQGDNTDGAIIWGVALNDTSYVTAINLLTIEGLISEGRSPSEIDEKLYFDLPQLAEDDLNFIILLSYRLMYYLDGGDVENAISVCNRLEDLAEYFPEFYSNALLSDVLFCECCLKGDLELSKELYNGLELYLKREDTMTTNRILAAYELYVNKDKKVALSYVDRARRLSKVNEIKGLVKFELKLIDCIYEDISA